MNVDDRARPGGDPSPLSRRRFLQLSAAAGAGLLMPIRLAGGTAFAQDAILDPTDLTRFRDPLPIPPSWPAGTLGPRGLRMAPSVHRFHSQLPETPTWGYGGASYLGPTIEARRGVPVRFTAHNDLGPHLLGVDTGLHGPDMADDQHHPRVSLHLHGGYTEPGSDGYPEDTFVPGESHVYRYDNDQQAGTIWYHDHALGITRLNVYAGLAGFYLLRDTHEASLGLPPQPFEIPLAIQDKTFHPDGSLYYPSPLGAGVLRQRPGRQRPGLAAPRGRTWLVPLPPAERLERPVLQPAAAGIDRRAPDVADRDGHRPALPPHAGRYDGEPAGAGTGGTGRRPGGPHRRGLRPDAPPRRRRTGHTAAVRHAGRGP